jgi:hypothetical protein
MTAIIARAPSYNAHAEIVRGESFPKPTDKNVRSIFVEYQMLKGNAFTVSLINLTSHSRI